MVGSIFKGPKRGGTGGEGIGGKIALVPEAVRSMNGGIGEGARPGLGLALGIDKGCAGAIVDIIDAVISRFIIPPKDNGGLSVRESASGLTPATAAAAVVVGKIHCPLPPPGLG